jgi:hypothetical protein
MEWVGTIASGTIRARIRLVNPPTENRSMWSVGQVLAPFIRGGESAYRE